MASRRPAKRPASEPATSHNVRKVVETFKKDPQLLLEMHQVLTKAYEKAGVTLTQSEKAQVLSALAAGSRGHSVIWPW